MQKGKELLLCLFLSELNRKAASITYKIVIKIVIILIPSMLLRMLTNAFRRNVVTHEVTIQTHNTKKNKLKLFFISDIHRRRIDRKLISKIDKDIDFIVIGGDLAEKGVTVVTNCFKHSNSF